MSTQYNIHIANLLCSFVSGTTVDLLKQLESEFGRSYARQCLLYPNVWEMCIRSRSSDLVKLISFRNFPVTNPFTTLTKWSEMNACVFEALHPSTPMQRCHELHDVLKGWTESEERLIGTLMAVLHHQVGLLSSLPDLPKEISLRAASIRLWTMRSSSRYKELIFLSASGYTFKPDISVIDMEQAQCIVHFMARMLHDGEMSPEQLATRYGQLTAMKKNAFLRSVGHEAFDALQQYIRLHQVDRLLLIEGVRANASFELPCTFQHEDEVHEWFHRWVIGRGTC